MAEPNYVGADAERSRDRDRPNLVSGWWIVPLMALGSLGWLSLLVLFAFR